MTAMSQSVGGTPSIDPEASYANPMALAEARTLSVAQKLELLDRWEFAANARLTAGDEGMPVTAAREARDSELVRSIEAARKVVQGTAQ
jgi:hypothetical protein